MPDAATLEARLAEAEEALHRLELGEAETSVSAEGRAVAFRQADPDVLRRRIADLRRQLGRGGPASFRPVIR